MSAERELSFVDTNVLVYAFDRSSSPKKTIAQRLINELMEQDRLRVSTQILQELFVTLTRKVSWRCTSEQALDVMHSLAAWPLTVAEYPVIRAAVRLADEATISLWDALVVVAAARSGATVLNTEGLNDGRRSWGFESRIRSGRDGPGSVGQAGPRPPRSQSAGQPLTCGNL